jgi:hypothetical protein
MYCSGCGSPIAQGLSFCNRCGTGLRERTERGKSKPAEAVPALVTAMVVVALAAMGLMLGGSIALKGSGFGEQPIVLFMFLIFFTAAITEIFLYRQLGRLAPAPGQPLALQTPAAMPTEFRAPQPLSLAEPVPSVTENTTRTLEYAREERRRPRTP